jgi:hypothetical protein
MLVPTATGNTGSQKEKQDAGRGGGGRRLTHLANKNDGD